MRGMTDPTKLSNLFVSEGLPEEIKSSIWLLVGYNKMILSNFKLCDACVDFFYT